MFKFRSLNKFAVFPILSTWGAFTLNQSGFAIALLEILVKLIYSNLYTFNFNQNNLTLLFFLFRSNKEIKFLIYSRSNQYITYGILAFNLYKTYFHKKREKEFFCSDNIY